MQLEVNGLSVREPAIFGLPVNLIDINLKGLGEAGRIYFSKSAKYAYSVRAFVTVYNIVS
jgi:hypothetical protein